MQLASSLLEWTEFEWVAYGSCLTLTQIATLLRRSGQDGLRAWKRCRNLVLRQAFRVCLAHAQQLLNTGPPTAQRACWNGGYIVASGLIPREILATVVTNDRFGYVHDGRWREFNIVNTTCLRMYWESILGLQGVQSLRSELQHFLTNLPGETSTCRVCGWCLPMCDMFTSEQCTKCWDCGSDTHALTLFKGSPLRMRCVR
jgi:hypothetical protein